MPRLALTLATSFLALSASPLQASEALPWMQPAIIAQHEGALQRVHQPLGQHHRIALVADALGQDRKLVAAQARQHVIGAQLLLHAPRHLHQQLVAHVVAQTVVDQFEAVEVDEHQRPHMRRVGLRARHRTGQAFHEAAPVGQPGEAVVKGQVLQAGLGVAPG